MEYVVIDGNAYDVFVTAVEEEFHILYSENTGRTLSETAKMALDPIGTFYGHKVTFRCKQGKEEEFDALWDLVATPRYVGIPVKIAHNQGTLDYEAYISQGNRQLKRIDKRTGKVYWDEFELNIVPMEAQVIPIGR